MVNSNICHTSKILKEKTLVPIEFLSLKYVHINVRRISDKKDEISILRFGHR